MSRRASVRMGARVAVCAALGWIAAVLYASGDDPLKIRITSPLGRTGSQGTVRIVAQVIDRPDAVLGPVQFFVDGVLQGTDTDGPPYAVEWVDENPFQAREIRVHVADDRGNAGTDAVHLDPYEIIEATQVNSVLLEASVQDQYGRFIKGLSASNFRLSENRIPQTLQVVTQETVPATFALLIDGSHSMHRRIEFVREAAGRLVSFLRPNDRVIVAPFSRQIGSVTGPTDDRRTVAEAIGAVEPVGGTSILDSLVEMTEKLPAGAGRRVIVLLTDGYDENSKTPLSDALLTVKASGITVYTIGIGGVAGISFKGEQLLRRIAAESGGRAFFPPREEDLVEVYDRLATDAQNRYLITYTPMNQKADGSWRALTLKTTPDEYRIRTRDGYQAPKPVPIRPTLEFTVVDPGQRYVEVSADDLVVLEDGVAQKVDTFQEAVTPVSIVLVLDQSGSMKQAAPDVVEAARDFVESVRPQDSLAVVLFSDKPIFAHDLTTNRQSSFEAINAYQANGGTALYDALHDALIRLKRAEGRKAVVVLTDGRDENNPGTAPGSVATFDQVLDLTRQTGATVFGIGLGTNVDRPPLERLAQMSGGQAYFPVEVASLRDDYTRVVENLRRRFVLSYTSTNSNRDGSWRTVSIKPRSADAVVKSAGGYFAPER